MNEYRFIKTPINGLYEVARLEPFDYKALLHPTGRSGYMALSRDVPAITNILKLLHINYANDQSYLNPQPNNSYVWWHVDMLDQARDSALMGVLTYEGQGTLWKNQFDHVFQSKPWYLYLVKHDIEHASPLGHHDRYLVRYRFPRISLPWA